MVRFRTPPMSRFQPQILKSEGRSGAVEYFPPSLWHVPVLLPKYHCVSNDDIGKQKLDAGAIGDLKRQSGRFTAFRCTNSSGMSLKFQESSHVPFCIDSTLPQIRDGRSAHIHNIIRRQQHSVRCLHAPRYRSLVEIPGTPHKIH